MYNTAHVHDIRHHRQFATLVVGKLLIQRDKMSETSTDMISGQPSNSWASQVPTAN